MKRITSRSLPSACVFAACAMAFGCLHHVPASAAVDIASSDLTGLSLESLMELEVTSVSKRPQSLNDAAAAVFVLTGDDILNSGARSIPDALRLVPGLFVSSITSSSWAVSSRGFGGQFSNKLLVLIDGRTVYSPLFSGVFWDRQYPILDNIARIEVIRGPGGSLWGANAVNGVINIITKDSAETLGAFARAGAGTDERYGATARYGARIGDDGSYRITANSFDRGARRTGDSQDGNDDWGYHHLEFRSDLRPGASDEVDIHAELFEGQTSGLLKEPILSAPFERVREEDSEALGGSLNVGWTNEISETESWSLRGFYDYAALNDARLETEVQRVDMEFQHNIDFGDVHSFVWGFGARTYWFDVESTPQLSFTKTQGNEKVVNGFVQDTIELIPDTAFLTLGTKVEYNSDTGVNFQPSIRGSYNINESNTVWAAVSRAVRTPSLGERFAIVNTDVLAPGAPGNPSAFPLLLQGIGNDDLTDERLTAYELGYRTHVNERLSFDVAGFAMKYRNLVNAEIGSTTFSTVGGNHLETEIEIRNNMRGYSYGAEITANADVADNWRIQASYSYLQVNLELDNNINSNSSLAEEDATPTHQAVLRSSHRLDDETQLNVDFRYVSRLFSQSIDSYLVADVRLSHQIDEGWEVALTGRNLAFHDHREFGSGGLLGTQPTRVPRSVFFEVRAQF